MAKYNDAYLLEVIERVISRTGCYQRAIEAAGISKQTFYEWLKKPDFFDRVTRARRKFAECDLDELEQVFRERLKVAMEGAIETWESEERTTLPDGKEIIKRTKRTVKRPPAQWAFDIVAPAVPGNFGKGKDAPLSDAVLDALESIAKMESSSKSHKK